MFLAKLFFSQKIFSAKAAAIQPKMNIKSLGEMCHTQDFCIGNFTLRCLGFNLVKNEIIKLWLKIWDKYCKPD